MSLSFKAILLLNDGRCRKTNFRKFTIASKFIFHLHKELFEYKTKVFVGFPIMKNRSPFMILLKFPGKATQVKIKNYKDETECVPNIHVSKLRLYIFFMGRLNGRYPNPLIFGLSPITLRNIQVYKTRFVLKISFLYSPAGESSKLFCSADIKLLPCSYKTLTQYHSGNLLNCFFVEVMSFVKTVNHDAHFLTKIEN